MLAKSVLVACFSALIALVICKEQGKICQTEQCKQTASLITNSIDKSVNPCDNFYQYSCGNWIINHPVKDDQDHIGESNYAKLQYDLIDDLIRLLNESSVKNDNKYLHPLINFYNGCMDSDKRNSNKKRDYEIVREAINRTGGWPMIEPNWDQNNFNVETAIIESMKLRFTSSFLNIRVIKDFHNTSQPIIAITEHYYPGYGELTGVLPDLTLKSSKKNKKTKSKNDKFSYYMKLSDNEKMAIQMVVEELTGLPIDNNTFSKEAEDQYQVFISGGFGFDNIYYLKEHYDEIKIAVKDLKQFKALNFTRILYEVMKSENIVVNENDMILVDRDLLNNLEDLKQYTKRQIADNMALDIAMDLVPFTTPELADMSIWWSGGAPQDLPKTCFAHTLVRLPELLSRLYYDKMFEKDAIEDMKLLISSLREALHQTLKENQWMDQTSKEEAINKLEHIAQQIAFPKGVINLTELEENHKQFEKFSVDNFLPDALNIFAHKKSENFKELKHPDNSANHWKMPMNGVVVNAFYQPQTNSIYFPAGIANLPFYGHTRPGSANAAQIGMVIAHELTHAFDNLGREFDEFGNVREWMSQNSSKLFSDKSKCFVEQYGKFSYDIGQNEKKSINGGNTLGENIADCYCKNRPMTRSPP